MNEKIKTSKKRIIGASLFGLLLGSYIQKAFEYTIPRIFSIVKKISIEEGYEIYVDSFTLLLILTILISFFIGCISGFLARKKGVLAGLLANSIFIASFAFLLCLSFIDTQNIYIGIISIQIYFFIGLVFITFVSILGGYFGQKYYSPERDLDLGKNKLTIFGIRWFHYFWILPFIIYSFLSTAIIVVYAHILVFLAEFYLAIHPSIWFSLWLIYIIFMPILAIFSIYLLGFAFIRFWELMQYGYGESKWWMRSGKILLYGIGAPALSFFIAGTIADITYNMPKPVAGDWKIGIGLIFVVPIIALVFYIFSWLKDRINCGKNKK